MKKYWLISFSFLFFTAVTALTARSQSDSLYTYRSASAYGIGKFYMGREIARIISSSGSKWLDRDSRQQEENSSLAVSKMELKKNEIVADIGAGTGYYSFQLAKYVPQGKVIAVEIQDAFINILKERISSLKAENIEVVKGDTATANLPENSIDCALMVDVYHELEYPHEMLQAIHKNLKPGGRLILLEYKAEDAKVGIIPLHKTSVAQIKKELEANGFIMKQAGDFLPIQHFFVFEKK